MMNKRSTNKCTPKSQELNFQSVYYSFSQSCLNVCCAFVSVAVVVG